jgi:hypothetical protein
MVSTTFRGGAKLVFSPFVKPLSAKNQSFDIAGIFSQTLFFFNR